MNFQKPNIIQSHNYTNQKYTSSLETFRTSSLKMSTLRDGRTHISKMNKQEMSKNESKKSHPKTNEKCSGANGGMHQTTDESVVHLISWLIVQGYSNRKIRHPPQLPDEVMRFFSNCLSLCNYLLIHNSSSVTSCPSSSSGTT